ncbi:MAG: beta-ketoacyl synthase chain length factor [Polyangiales bacterium]
MTLRAQVMGIALWSPRHATWSAFRDGVAAETPHRPACAGVAPSLLRGASVATCAAIDVLGQAAAAGGADLRHAATVFGSTLGEIQTAVALSAMIRHEGLPSPMRFKNSVHNAAGGLASIAHGNTGFSTSLSAGGDLLGCCLAEALSWLAERGGDVLVVLAEEEIPAPLPGHGDAPALAAALHLRAGDGPITLVDLALDPAAPTAAPEPGFVGCPTAAAIPLLRAIDARRAGTVGLSLGPAPRWRVSLSVAL